MAIGIATWLLSGRPIGDIVTLAAELGFGAVSFTLPPTATSDTAGLLEARQAVVDCGLTTTFHLGIAGGSQGEARAVLRRQLDVVRAFIDVGARVSVVSFDPAVWVSGATRVRGFAGEKTALVCADAWQVVGPSGAAVAVENWNGITTAIGAWEFMHLVTPDVPICALLDLGHLNLSYHSGELGLLNPHSYISSFPLTIVEVHVHDNHGRRDEHLFPGQGNADLSGMIDAICSAGAAPVFTLEAAPGLQPIDVGCSRALEQLRSALEWLQERVPAAEHN